MEKGTKQNLGLVTRKRKQDTGKTNTLRVKKIVFSVRITSFCVYNLNSFLENFTNNVNLVANKER